MHFILLHFMLSMITSLQLHVMDVSMDLNKVSLIHDLGTKHGRELHLLWVPLQNSGGLHIQRIQNSESIP